MKLEWKRQAIADREGIFDFIAQDNSVAALEFDESIEQKAALLTSQPKSGRPGRMRGTREWVIHPRYVIVYRLAATQLEILRVLHTARQLP
ncbi:MAG: type II toxin-antitoxin system RelE/ParE family toxin [Betaproteobacteria bacterium]|nr:type II toxin-antitoxin system RelE/ParE family toxin [Betaproteobacteria bacterium]